MSNQNKKAVVWGAGGFTGGELLRLLATHPQLELTAALSNTHAGKSIGQVYPNLAPFTEVKFVAPSDWSWDTMKKDGWVLFSAQPHKETMKVLPPVIEKLAGAEVKVVDLSGDFRLTDPQVYQTYYGTEHVAVKYLNSFVYGLPERNRNLIAQADYVANPGCFATCAQLAVLPMASAPKKIGFVAIDSKTGSSGAGVTPKLTTHHPNRMNNFKAYKQLVHQHLPEIQDCWTSHGGSVDTPISFVPQMAPIVRGIFTTAHFFSESPVTEKEVGDWYADCYKDAPFVRIVDGSPEITDVWGTNRCDISVAAEGQKIVVTAAIDNLIKGASGQAIQNANLMCGFDETSGLLAPAPAPV
jgi:N-acetyl-gamma-glutamyl-phosphate reductase